MTTTKQTPSANEGKNSCYAISFADTVSQAMAIDIAKSAPCLNIRYSLYSGPVRDAHYTHTHSLTHMIIIMVILKSMRPLSTLWKHAK